jgi:protein tyrosine phosphatase (PTP) superfamily phosphohydrolase (DUF442 family)
VYFTPEKFEDLHKQFEHCVHVQVKEPESPRLDLDDISEMVENMMKTQGPVFMFCVSGMVAGGVAIKI